MDSSPGRVKPKTKIGICVQDEDLLTNHIEIHLFVYVAGIYFVPTENLYLT
jgi:hypothetical protein